VTRPEGASRRSLARVGFYENQVLPRAIDVLLGNEEFGRARSGRRRVRAYRAT